jgi:hypothetical protein
MAERRRARWPLLGVAILYPLAAFASLPRLMMASAGFVWPIGSISASVAGWLGLVAAGATALTLTREFEVSWPSWLFGLASYGAGSLVAFCVYGYFELVRSEFGTNRSQ